MQCSSWLTPRVAHAMGGALGSVDGTGIEVLLIAVRLAAGMAMLLAQSEVEDSMSS